MKKIFTKEIQIALAAIAAVALLVYGINFLKGKNLFSSTNLYYVTFDNISGLTVSNAVYANGYPVGIVREIKYPYSTGIGKVVVGVEIDKEMNVPVGTTAELESSMLGEVKMNLVLGGNPLAKMTKGDTIVGQPAGGLLSQTAELLPVVQQMLPKLDSILANINKLTADPALAASLQNTEVITANLKETTSRMNGLLATEVPQMMTKVNNLGDNMVAITNKLDAVDLETPLLEATNTLKNTNAITETLNTKLQSRDNSVGLLLNDRGLYDNLTSTMASADSLLIDLRMHPKRYVHFSIFGKKDK